VELEDAALMERLLVWLLEEVFPQRASAAFRAAALLRLDAEAFLNGIFYPRFIF